MLPCLFPNSIILNVIPLLALGFEREAKIRSLGPFENPIFVHSGNSGSKKVLRDIRKGVYTHILGSRELFTGRRFMDIFQDARFRTLVKWVVMDELHSVAIWGKEFRQSYAQLEAMRHTLGRKPWFGCTATLDDPTFYKMCEHAAFRETTTIKRTSIDLPDVAFIRSSVRRLGKSSLKPLHFVFADAQRLPDDTDTWVPPVEGLRMRDTTRYVIISTFFYICDFFRDFFFFFFFRDRSIFSHSPSHLFVGMDRLDHARHLWFKKPAELIKAVHSKSLHHRTTSAILPNQAFAGSPVSLQGTGSILLQLGDFSIPIHDVAYNPSSNSNILSFGQLQGQFFSFSYHSDRISSLVVPQMAMSLEAIRLDSPFQCLPY